jgi:hypothetical protein
MLTQIVLFLLLQAQAGMQAQHSWDLPGIDIEENAPLVFTPSQQQERECHSIGNACFSPGGSATSEGTELRVGAPPITVLARGAQVAGVGALHGTSPDQPWQVEMVANFARRSTDGPIVVAVMDGEDPEALASHLALVLWDVQMSPAKHLGLRFLLSPDQGFRASHSYRLRVVQQQGKAERILAEGEFHLE